MRPALLAVLLALPGAASAEILGCPGSAMPWEHEDGFVRFPAGVAASPAGLVGAALALAMAPADLVEYGVSRRPQEGGIPRFAHVGLCGGVYLGEGLAAVGGAPFWLLERLLWKGPKALYERSRRTQQPAGTASAPKMT